MFREKDSGKNKLSCHDFPIKEKLRDRSWFVHRSNTIRKIMSGYWRKGPKNSSTMFGSTLEQKVVKGLNILFRNMEISGPVRNEFPNYKQLSSGAFHCHINEPKSRRSYVAIWVADETQKTISIVHVGSRENAPYNKKFNEASLISKAIEERDRSESGDDVPQLR